MAVLRSRFTLVAMGVYCTAVTVFIVRVQTMTTTTTTSRPAPSSSATADLETSIAHIPLRDSVSLNVEIDPSSVPVLKNNNSTVFAWNCVDSCDCLPPRSLSTDDADTGNPMQYFHSSYKTGDQSKWPPGWTFFWNQWLTLHTDTTHVFWTDETNELLSECIGPRVAQQYRQQGHRLGAIDKVDFSRAMYMYYYGGLYHDMDVCPLRSQRELYDADEYRDANILLQGRHPEANAKLALEYAFTRRPGESFWQDFIEHGKSFGPDGLSSYFKQKDAEHGRIRVVPWEQVTPVEWDFKGISNDHICNDQLVRKADEHWDGFADSPCHEALKAAGAFVFSSYTASWTNWGQTGKE